ncbi:hypothetical protein PFICI_03960 [Pestalotiopsis fici W106-1]|uniref:ABM domain-containing protein n=1 Tax=Pestalotiopsis fici (strain W106-1 / CGMCC3.15140) TaxID=1229662 RepID=W3XIT9_PESFW|nr:uncharacterized protein PFICI_03960 [Pestalotiopsis fici W106-1]ETS85935.1 hypothetical protein PFICI_03960 [Pestalotiopsis fici W106-1]
MSAVTEIVQFNPKKDLNFDDAAHRLTRTIAQQSGVTRVRYARRHEDPLKGAIFIDWRALSDHKAFMEKEYYGPFLEVVRHLVDGPLSIYHVPFHPHPPTVLDNLDGRGRSKVAEVVHAYFPLSITSVQQQEILADVQQFIDQINPKGASGEHAHGFALEDVEFKGEKCRALVLVLGWDSVEAHHAYRQTEDFAKNIPLLRNLPGLKGMEMWHVMNRETKV